MLSKDSVLSSFDDDKEKEKKKKLEDIAKDIFEKVDTLNDVSDIIKILQVMLKIKGIIL